MFLAPLPQPLSPWQNTSICLLSYHHIDSLSLPLSIIRTLLSVRLSCAPFFFTLLACFCQTLFHSVSSCWPLLFILTRCLSSFNLFNRHFIIYTTSVSVHAHGPGACLFWISVTASPRKLEVRTGPRQRTHRLAFTHACTDGVQVYVWHSAHNRPSPPPIHFTIWNRIFLWHRLFIHRLTLTLFVALVFDLCLSVSGPWIASPCLVDK